MAHVFGPVPSRRLGRSLGVDPVPFKTCNWNCVYCQLGHTAPLTGERRDYVPTEAILAEIRAAVFHRTPKNARTRSMARRFAGESMLSSA